MGEEVGVPVARVLIGGRETEVVWDSGQLRVAGEVLPPTRLMAWDHEGRVNWATDRTRAWLYEFVACEPSPSTAARRPHASANRRRPPLSSDGWLPVFGCLLILSLVGCVWALIALPKVSDTVSMYDQAFLYYLAIAVLLPPLIAGMLVPATLLSRRAVRERTLGQHAWGWVIAAVGAVLIAKSLSTVASSLREALSSFASGYGIVAALYGFFVIMVTGAVIALFEFTLGAVGIRGAFGMTPLLVPPWRIFSRA